MATPTIKPTSISHAATISRLMSASRATTNTSGPLMSLSLPFAVIARAGGQSRSPGTCDYWMPAFAGMTASNLHLQDVLISRDHFVAHRHQRLEGGFGFGDRGDDVDHVSLAAGHGRRLRVGFLRGFGDRVDDIFEHVAEIRPAVLRIAERVAQSAADLGRLVVNFRQCGIGIGGNGRRRHGLLSDQLLRMSMVRWSMRRVAVMTLRLAS